MTRIRKLRRESLGFAIGSLCFALGALPGYLALVGEQADNVTYVVGAVFFTAAAFIQLRLSGRWRRGAWRSRADWDDWWSAAVQFLGTLCFNVTTIAALATHPTVAQANRSVWRRTRSARPASSSPARSRSSRPPTARGSGTPRRATGGAPGSTWPARSRSPPRRSHPTSCPTSGELLDAELVNSGTFVGAICFLIAALLVRPPATPRR